MRILFLQKRLLFPTDTGGKVRTLNVLRHLAKWHDVTYLCNLQEAERSHVEAMTQLGLRMVTVPWRESPRGSIAFYRDLLFNIASRYPFNVSKDYDRRLRRKIVELLQMEYFDLIVCDFVQMTLNVLGLPGPRRLLFQHNVEAEIFRRHATSDCGRLRRKYMALQWRKMRRFEPKAGGEFDSVVAVSERDKRIFESEYGWRHVAAIDTAVDVETYRPCECKETPDRLVFVGSMDWLPNVDGVRFFVKDVWPHIRAARPNATFHVVGRNPNGAVRRLEKVAGVKVTGTVADVRPHLAEAALLVVPLLVGGGTRLKIFEAMAMGKAVVSTSLGAEGLNVTPAKHLEIADDSLEFAEKVLELLKDQKKRRRMAEDAREFVVANFSAERVARQFDRICRETAGVV